MIAKTGEFAFPSKKVNHIGTTTHQDMTLRDWFAGHAEPLDRTVNDDTLSILIGIGVPDDLVKGSLDHWRIWAKADAAWRYIQADAMVAARKAGDT